MGMKRFDGTKMRLVSAACAAALALPAIARAQATDNPFPADTEHPALFLVGDSIVRTGVGTGETGPWGWGAELIPMFDSAKIHVYNEGLGGRSSRGYIQEGAWQKVLDRMQKGDWVIVQFGHNDAKSSENYPDRLTITGDDDATQQIESPVTHQPETIHSYGWYMRQYVADAKAKGANVIICSPPPRNLWADGKIARGLDGYAGWARDAAKQSGAYFCRPEYDLGGQVRRAGTGWEPAAVQRQPAQPQGGRAPECGVGGDGTASAEYSAGEGPAAAGGGTLVGEQKSKYGDSGRAPLRCVGKHHSVGLHGPKQFLTTG